jgi:hypothetical protein
VSLAALIAGSRVAIGLTVLICGDQDVDPVACAEPDDGVGVHESAVVDDGHRKVTGWPVEFAEDMADGGRIGCEAVFDDAVSGELATRIVFGGSGLRVGPFGRLVAGAPKPLRQLDFDAQTRCPYSTNPTSAANAFRLTRHNCANDISPGALARRSARTESPLRAAWPQQGTGTSRAPARASIGISDTTDSSGRSAMPTTAVTEPTTPARPPTNSAAVSAGPPAGPAAASLRPATKAAGAGHHSAAHSAAAEGGTGPKPAPLVGQPAVDGSGPGHRAGGRPGRRGRC